MCMADVAAAVCCSMLMAAVAVTVFAAVVYAV